MNMQTKLLDMIEKAIAKAGLEPIKNADFANTGVIFAQHGLTTAFSLRYDFQISCCSLHFTGPAVDESSEADLSDEPPLHRLKQSGRTWTLSFHSLDYTEATRLKHLMQLVEMLSVQGAKIVGVKVGGKKKAVR